MSDDATVRISVSPDPPSASFPMTVCYDFSGLSATEVTISLDFGEAGGMSVKPTQDDPCVQVSIPAGATSVLLEDMSGRSADVSRVITA